MGYLDDDTVYLEADLVVTRLDPRTGDEAWSSTADSTSAHIEVDDAGIEVVGDHLVLSTETGVFVLERD